MEQHPIPQNITGFQFRLIGDMTLKQFAYLATGVLGGYLVLQLGLPTLLSWSLAILVGGGGFAFAFVPIEERPLDRWLTSFLKSVYSPTQFLWKKSVSLPEVLISSSPIILPKQPQKIITKEETAVKVSEYLFSLPSTQKGSFDKLEEKEGEILEQIVSLFQTTQLEPTKPVSSPQSQTTSSQPQTLSDISTVSSPPPVPPPLKKIVPPAEDKKETKSEEFTKKTEELTNKITALEKELTLQTITKERFLEIQEELRKLLAEKEKLTNELVELRKALLAKDYEATVKPTILSQTPTEPTVKIVPPQFTTKIGTPKASIFPNVPTGVVKTKKGTILSDILVEIRDQTGTPVRALKTNKLGQFAVTTPLPNGTYTLHLEDPQKIYSFDTIEISLKGEVVLPLEIFAKTPKDKLREDLTKRIFSQDIL